MVSQGVEITLACTRVVYKVIFGKASKNSPWSCQ